MSGEPQRPRRRRHGGKALVDRWLRDAHRIMEDYPELFVDAVNRVEEEAERHFAPNVTIVRHEEASS